MGRKTWESIPKSFRPLEGRHNIILSTTTDHSHYTNEKTLVSVAKSFPDALDIVQKLEPPCDQVFVIGGEHVYREAIGSGLVKTVIYTEVSNVPKDQKFDAFFPDLPKSVWICNPYNKNVDNESNQEKCNQDPKSGLTYRFLQYTRIPQGPEMNPEEMQYLNLCRDIIENGVR
jgi:dihydrofolate reductase